MLSSESKLSRLRGRAANIEGGVAANNDDAGVDVNCVAGEECWADVDEEVDGAVERDVDLVGVKVLYLVLAEEVDLSDVDGLTRVAVEANDLAGVEVLNLADVGDLDLDLEGVGVLYLVVVEEVVLVGVEV